MTKVHNRPLFDELAELGIEAVTADENAGDFLWSEVTEEGTEQTLSTTLDVAWTRAPLVHQLVTSAGQR